jgi:hypothetical protein
MSPADGSGRPPVDAVAGRLSARRAVLLHGGRAAMTIDAADAPPPAAGAMAHEGAEAAWAAHVWPAPEGGWRGVAVADAPPAAGAEVVGPDGARWRLDAAPRLDVAAEPLAEFVRAAGPEAMRIMAFLAERLAAGDAAEAPRARADAAFLAALLAAAAERDGFVEIVGAPDTGGLFAQGWSMSLGEGPATRVAPGATASETGIEVATFEREDVLAPAKGVCLIGKFWREADPAALEAVYFEREGRIMRLDVVRGALALEGERATAHLAHMAQRLRGPERTRAAFRRACRPRFAGADTLSGTRAPVAAAVDIALGAPDGGLLVAGWLLDPLRRVERALVKSTANLYARIDERWCPLPRPDLAAGFAADPRFAGLLDPSDAMHGFVAHAPARPEQVERAEIYLELVLDDGGCLFKPIAVAPFDAAERLPAVLAALAPEEPELGRVVDEHLAPFLDAAAPRPRRPAAARVRPHRLGGAAGAREVAAIVPFTSFAELEPMLALLAGTPDAAPLELALIAPRARAAEALPRLAPAFEFYGLAGALTLAPGRDGGAAALDLAVAATGAEAILMWSPAALPRAPGWLARLRAEAAALPTPGLISPALLHEDGSIAFGGATPDGAAGACALSGYDAGRLPRGAPRRTAAGAAEVALMGRRDLEAAGGFAGRLFGDAFAHVDLAERLERAGRATWCSGSVEFWLLDAGAAEAPSPLARLVRRIDAALLGRRGRPVAERAR